MDGDVLARLLKPDDAQFDAAFLELYLFAAFCGAKWPCERVTGRGRTPDFKVVASGGAMFVEATTARGPRMQAESARRTDLLLEAVDALECDGFTLGVEVVTAGGSPLPPGRVRKELADWLVGLDPDGVLAAVRGAPADAESDVDAGYPLHVTARDGWEIMWTAQPLPREWRGRGGRLIATEHVSAGVDARDDKRLYAALKQKAGRYGHLDGPYLIAINEELPLPVDVQGPRVDALYGTSAVVVAGPCAGHAHRHADGFWRRRGGTWRHRRVSGVLFLDGLRPWTARSAVPELWVHPEAELAVPGMLPYWRVHRVDRTAGQGRLTTVEPTESPIAFWTRAAGSER